MSFKTQNSKARSPGQSGRAAARVAGNEERLRLEEQMKWKERERREEELRKRIPNSRNPRNLDSIEGGRVYQALHIESKSVLDALCRAKKCLRRSM